MGLFYGGYLVGLMALKVFLSGVMKPSVEC